MSLLRNFIILLLFQGVIVSSTVHFFLYPLPIPGRILSGQTSGLSSVASVSNNGIPFSNFHFQVRNTNDNSYHFGYDAEKSYREEKRDAFGVVTGRYGYLDPTGIFRSVEYIADENGYRAKSTNQFLVAPLVSPSPSVSASPPAQAPTSTIQVIGPIPKPISQFY